MSDQCAIDESGSLKEARDIEFFFSESETRPLKNPGDVGKSYASLSLLS